MYVIFDLDGTLSDCSHRIHLIGSGAPETAPPDWDEFYRLCVHDRPIMPVINTFQAFRAAGARLEIWTGRSDFVRKETEEWLRKHCISPHYLTRMRPHGNHENDASLKMEWLIENGTSPDLVFEDRSRVVEMWRSFDIACCQVAPGDF